MKTYVKMFSFVGLALVLALLALSGLSVLVWAQSGIEVSPGYSMPVKAGETFTYTHVVTNSQPFTDSVIVNVAPLTSEGWPVALASLYPTGTMTLGFMHIAPTQTVTFNVWLTVPATATRGVTGTTTITVTSVHSPTQVQTIHDFAVLPLAHIYLPMLVRNYPPPPPSWQQLTGTAGGAFRDIAICATNTQKQFATTSDNGLYRSIDGGETWQAWVLAGKSARSVVVATDANCTAYVGVWGEGIYKVSDQNATLINAGQDALHYTYALALSPNGQKLYAGTSSNGIYETEVATVAWTSITEGKLTGDAARIRSLYFIGDVLYAGSRECSLYKLDLERNEITSMPVVDKTGGCDNQQVWAIADLNGVLYAGLADLGLYKQTGNGWERVNDVPETTIHAFGLLAWQNHLYVSAYEHGIYQCQNSTYQVLLNPDLATRSLRGLTIAELETDKYYLFAASDDGLWRVQLTP